jgi:aryl-alcohol dehydrogenase-like predicted oxidoreductase
LSTLDSFYRTAQGLRLSTLGIGTYLGDADDATDIRYTNAVLAAIDGGITLIDSAINYRNQRSERSIGAALRERSRDDLVICTKAGFLTPGAIPDSLGREDVAGGMHSMAPHFLADQIDRSRANLGIDTIDAFYLHNPETQIGHVPREIFDERLRAAFDRLEALADAGAIRYYGAATWTGFREPNQLDLDHLVSIARAAGGESHRFRFIQLPFNLAMLEALSRGVLDRAPELGITVIASATLLQARLIGGLPDDLHAKFQGCASDADRAIQFTRSAPGITAALVGMSDPAHVESNLAVARIPPLDSAAFRSLFS